MSGNDFDAIGGKNRVAARFRHMTAIGCEEVKEEDTDQ